MTTSRRVRMLGRAAARIAALVVVLTVTAFTVIGSQDAKFFQERFKTGQTVAPAYEGWEQNPDGSFNLLFGYFNRNWEEQTHVPIGPANSIEPGGPDQGQRPRLAEGSPDSHHDASDGQRGRAGCECADERSGAEDDYAREQHLLPAEQIAECAAGEHQRREREHVAVDDPLQARHAGAQARLDVRERNADDHLR